MNEPVNLMITCKNCGHEFAGKYCSNCGEKVYTHHDKTIIHLVEETAHFITHLDGTFFNTLRALTVPGKLSTDYCEGVRQRYFRPISFFLLIVVLYLLFPLLPGLNQQLYFHTENPFYGNYAAKKIALLLQHSGLTMTQLSEVFHEKSEKVSKLLLLILIPVSAIILQVFTFKKKRLFFDQAIFATELNTVFILLGFLIFPFTLKIIHYILHFFLSEDIEMTDVILGFVILVVMLAYMVIATKKFYGFKQFSAMLVSIAFVILYALFFQFIYKFILFMLVIWQIH